MDRCTFLEYIYGWLWVFAITQSTFMTGYSFLEHIYEWVWLFVAFLWAGVTGCGWMWVSVGVDRFDWVWVGVTGCGGCIKWQSPYESGFAVINCDVPQGSVFQPLLFSLYINNLNQAIKFCKVPHFTDDIKLSCPSNSIKKLKKLINAD